jgi:hypothetical protein
VDLDGVLNSYAAPACPDGHPEHEFHAAGRLAPTLLVPTEAALGWTRADVRRVAG